LYTRSCTKYNKKINLITFQIIFFQDSKLSHRSQILALTHTPFFWPFYSHKAIKWSQKGGGDLDTELAPMIQDYLIVRYYFNISFWQKTSNSIFFNIYRIIKKNIYANLIQEIISILYFFSYQKKVYKNTKISSFKYKH